MGVVIRSGSIGSITKQGNTFLRSLLVESVQTVNRLDEGFRREYQHRLSHEEVGGEGGGSAEVSHAIVLDAEDEYSLSGDRSHRGQPEMMAWSAKARPVASPFTLCRCCPPHLVVMT